MKYSAFGRYSKHTHAPGQARGLNAIAIRRGDSSQRSRGKVWSLPENNYGQQSLPPQANHKHPATNAPSPSTTHTHPLRHPPFLLTPKHPCPPNTHLPQQANRTHHKQTSHAPHNNTQYTYLHIGGATYIATASALRSAPYVRRRLQIVEHAAGTLSGRRGVTNYYRRSYVATASALPTLYAYAYARSRCRLQQSRHAS